MPKSLVAIVLVFILFSSTDPKPTSSSTDIKNSGSSDLFEFENETFTHNQDWAQWFAPITCSPKEVHVDLRGAPANGLFKEIFGTVQMIRVNDCEKPLVKGQDSIVFDRNACGTLTDHANPISVRTDRRHFDFIFHCTEACLVCGPWNQVIVRRMSSLEHLSNGFIVETGTKIMIEGLPINSTCNVDVVSVTRVTMLSFNHSGTTSPEFIGLKNDPNDGDHYSAILQLEAHLLPVGSKKWDLEMVCSSPQHQNILYYYFTVESKEAIQTNGTKNPIYSIVLACLIAFAVVICIAICIFRCCSTRRTLIDFDVSVTMSFRKTVNISEHDPTGQIPNFNPHAPLSFSYRLLLDANPALSIPLNRLMIIRSLGSGSFGQVAEARLLSERQAQFKRLYDWLPPSLVPGKNVAVKKLRQNTTEKALRGFHLERRALAQIHLSKDEDGKQFIVRLHGFYSGTNNFAIVMEHCSRTDLGRVLFENKPGSRIASRDRRSGRPITIDVSLILKWFKEIAAAGHFLSSIQVTHRDLAMRNVLITDDLTAKISDFGMARLYTEGQSFYLGEPFEELPVAWTSPESLQTRHFSESSDVWSFGVLQWEVTSWGASPYEGRTCLSRPTRELLVGGFRMARPSGCPMAIYTAIEACWQLDVLDRPSFNMLKNYFDSLLDLMKTREGSKLQLDEIIDGNDTLMNLLRMK